MQGYNYYVPKFCVSFWGWRDCYVVRRWNFVSYDPCSPVILSCESLGAAICIIEKRVQYCFNKNIRERERGGGGSVDANAALFDYVVAYWLYSCVPNEIL